ncbi:aspartate aminotransferase family protein [Litchfieldia alkalitelluris]|uniref:aspartate aminotransferase family protein n=1 Tax=Litchfieldia alkalitelluris TaxID=304268 RepID=UPI000997CE12|nr:aspartate aminotransferase family protein [Litchfieldia alkalitelluris]
MESWGQLVEDISELLAPSMAKDHPNLPVIKAEGCYYYGLDGRKYLDFTSGIATENVGHCHPKVVSAIKRGADSLMHGPSGVIIYESILKLAKVLQNELPGNLDCFFFSNSGSEAIEGAIKLAKHATKRPYVVSFTGCFHGRTIGALSVSTSKSKYRKFLQPNWLTYQVPYQDKFADEAEALTKLEMDFESLFAHQVTPEEVACVILEPVLGEGGYVVPYKSWLQRVREICSRHGILLIFDEVQTGFGRTGEMFAAQTFGVHPDIMAIAKAIASGVPLSATVASKELMQKWPLGSHGTTFGGNPLACEAGLASLEVIKEENLLQNSKELGKYAITRLKELQQKYTIIRDVRGIGLMIGIEFADPITGEPDGEAVKDILDLALEQGVLFYLCGNAGEVIRMIPPLIVTKEQIDEGLTMLEQAIQNYINRNEEKK